MASFRSHTRSIEDNMTKKNISLALIAIFAVLFIWAGVSIYQAWQHVASMAAQNTLLGYTVAWLASPLAVLAAYRIANE
jgi:hypothetical protein